MSATHVHPLGPLGVRCLGPDEYHDFRPLTVTPDGRRVVELYCSRCLIQVDTLGLVLVDPHLEQFIALPPALAKGKAATS